VRTSEISGRQRRVLIKMQKKGKNTNNHTAFLYHLPTKKNTERKREMRLVQEFFWKNWSKIVMFQGQKKLKLPFSDHPI
jgi:hypothetical protein